MDPAGVAALLGSDGMLRQAEPPRARNSQHHEDCPEEPATPHETWDSQQEKAGSYGTNYARFAHDALGLLRTKNVRQSREKQQRGDHVHEDRGCVGHGRIVVAKQEKD
jgi:hypothetical protein